MSLKSINPTQTEAWNKLQQHFESIKEAHMTTWFEHQPERAQQMSLKWEDFFLDYSKNRINAETLNLLKDLAEELQLSDAISKYFNKNDIHCSK